MGNGIDLVDRYKDMLKEDPASEVFAFLAEALYAQGQWRETVRVCRWGLGIHPQHLRARVLLGLALWETGDRAAAEEELEKARSKLEENASLYHVLAQLAEERDDIDRARRYFILHRSMQLDGIEEQRTPSLFTKMDFEQDIAADIAPEAALQEPEILKEEDEEADFSGQEQISEPQLADLGAEASHVSLPELAVETEMQDEIAVSQLHETTPITEVSLDKGVEERASEEVAPPDPSVHMDPRLDSEHEGDYQEAASSAEDAFEEAAEEEGETDPHPHLPFLVWWQEELGKREQSLPPPNEIFTAEDRELIRRFVKTAG
jgi:tetratricopeptide (TPR) repeat protein